MKNSGSNMGSVRRSNRATILKHINDHGPTSRKDLAEATGLTAAAVTQISADLMEEGVLRESGVQESRSAGRKKIFLEICYDEIFVYSINIELEKTTISISNLRGEEIALQKLDTNAGIDAEIFLKKVAEECKNLKRKQSKPVIACGVGVVGLVDSERGISKKAYGIWEEEVLVAQILQKELNVPIYLENNVNALALAERYYGIGRENDNLMLIKWGPGVGCALIIDQEIYEGRHNRAAELGHFIVEPDGERCACGRRGCLETKVSYTALQKIKPFQPEEFGQVYRKCEEFQPALDLFARSIVNSATIMAPNRIVLTGILFEDESIREELIHICEAYDKTWGKPRISYSTIADREDYIGPVAVAAHKILFS